MSLLQFLRRCQGVLVYALIGASGTGKSFRAKLIAEKYGMEVIVDDGLLIQDDKILAGYSAKREKTYLGAVRAALFDDVKQREAVQKALRKSGAKRILILGTSDKMVKRIAERLSLPRPSKVISIEDVASPEEIEEATRSRRVEGKHVIPVPAIEIEGKYSNIFYKAVQLFHRRGGVAPRSKLFEKSVVRPEFSKRGRLAIAEEALSQMVLMCVAEYDTQVTVKKLAIRSDDHGYRIVLTVDLPFGTQLTGKIHGLQTYIISSIEKYTGMSIEEVSIIIDKIIPVQGG
jgi:uncharacterized alkaline shock family protein YloU/adenylate kinase family enzyme